jgi:hypothetical protein
LLLLISIKQGMGSGRVAASCIKAFPPASDPVKPTALMAGCCTSADPTKAPEPKISAKVPAGRPHSRRLRQMTCPTISLVPGCAVCALTITGLPAASAEAVSPPATEKASGKLLAAKTATGPSGRSTERRSALGIGVRSGSAGSMRAMAHEPSSTIWAKSRS